jgi:hypothetical protein
MKKILPIIGLYFGILAGGAIGQQNSEVQLIGLDASSKKINEFYKWTSKDTVDCITLTKTTCELPKIVETRYQKWVQIPDAREGEAPILMLADICDQETPLGVVNGRDYFQLLGKTSAGGDTTHYSWDRMPKTQEATELLQAALRKVYEAKDDLVGKILIK